MKPFGTIPEIQCWNKKEFLAAWQAMNSPPIINLEGLVQGKIDTGFIYGGYLFRLVTPA